MKKLFAYLLPTVLAFTACSDEANSLTDGTFAPEERIYTFEAAAQAEPTNSTDTRIQFDPTTLGYTWEMGDEVRLFYRDAGAENSYNGLAEHFVAQKAGARTQFKAQTTAQLTESNKDYRMIYPCGKDGLFTIGTRESGSELWSQNASFEKRYNLMAAEATNQPSLATGRDFSVEFQQLTTVLRLFPKAEQGNTVMNNFKVTKIKIEFPKPIVGVYSFNPNSKGFDLVLKAENTENQLLVKLETPKKISELTPNDILVQVPPFNIAQGEQMVVTIYGDLPTGEKDLQQEIVIAPTKEIIFGRGKIRTLNLTLKEHFKKVTHTDLNTMLGTDFAPIGTHDSKSNECPPYPAINDNGYDLVGRVRCAASRVLNLGQDKVIVLENTYYRGWGINRLTNRSAFQMPTDDVLNGYHTSGTPFVAKDIRIEFDANVFFSGDQEKAAAPLTICLNHISNSTTKGMDSERIPIAEASITIDKVHTTAYGAKDTYDYAYPELGNNWHHYWVTIPASTFKDGDFTPNNDGTPSYIGFDINTDQFGCCIYLRNITFTYANEVRIQ